MKINSSYKESYLNRILNFLFADNYKFDFKKTLLGNILSKFNVPYIADISLIICLLLLWYEPFFDKYLPIIGNDYLPPLLLAFGLFIASKKAFEIRKYHLWYMLFLVFSLISAIVGIYLFHVGIMVVLGWLVFAQYLLSIFLGELLTNRRLFQFSIGVLTIPLLVKGFWQFFSGEGRGYSYLETAGIRVSSFFESPNTFAFILVLVILVLISKLFSEKKNKILYTFLLIPYSFLLVLTGSRTGIIALLVGIITILFLEKRRLLIWTPLALILLLVSRIRERFLIIFTENYRLDNAIDGRGWTFNNSIHIFRKYPVFGTGPGTYGGRFAKVYTSPVYFEGLQNGYVPLWTTDNQFLAILVQIGLFGILIFVGFLVSIFTAILKNKSTLGLTIFNAFIIMMIFANALEFSAVSLLIGAIIGSELKSSVKM